MQRAMDRPTTLTGFERLSLLVGLVGLVPLIGGVVVPLTKQGDFLSVAALVVFVGGAAGFIYVGRPRNRQPADLPASGIFQTFGTLPDQLVWNRPTAMTQLGKAIKEPQSKVVVVLGPSGAGKTVLLSRLLPTTTSVTGEREVWYVNSFTQWPQAADQLESSIVVLDQFEHALLDIDWTSDHALRRLEAIARDVEALKRRADVVIIGVRNDWYVHLYFIRHLIGSLQEAVVLSPDGAEVDPDVFRAFERRVDRIGPRELHSNALVGATPMELQASGQLMEIANGHPHLGVVDDVTLADPAVAVTTLVQLVVDASPNAEVSLRLLYALQSARERATTLTSNQLSAITGDDESATRSAVNHLEGYGLIDAEGNQLSLVHDAVIPSIDRLSIEVLEPSERDYVRAGAQDPRSVRRRRDRRLWYPRSVWAAIVVLVVTRAVLPVDSLWYSVSALPAPERSGLLDPVYLLTAIPFLAWCYYIVDHHVRVYAPCDESGFESTVTYLTTSLLIVVIVWTMFMPEWWVVAIAVGGLMQATKWLTYAVQGGRPPSVRRAWSLGAKRTYNNCGVLFVLGVVLAIATPSLEWSAGTTLAVYSVISIILSNAALYLYSQHCSPSAVSRSRSTLVRRVRR